jgi:hypothetical protein
VIQRCRQKASDFLCSEKAQAIAASCARALFAPIQDAQPSTAVAATSSSSEIVSLLQSSLLAEPKERRRCLIFDQYAIAALVEHSGPRHGATQH